MNDEATEKQCKELCSWLKVTVLELIGELDEMDEKRMKQAAMLDVKAKVLKSMERRLDLLRERAKVFNEDN